jgi:hypothetical protein
MCLGEKETFHLFQWLLMISNKIVIKVLAKLPGVTQKNDCIVIV